MASLAPTATLPPLGRLSSTPGQTVLQALQNLRSVYFPHQPCPILCQKKPSNSIRKGDETPFIDSGYASAEEDDDDNGRISLSKASIPNTFATPPDDYDSDEDARELLRADPFERAFAIKWLTGFISRAEIWVAEEEEDSVEGLLRSDLLEASSVILSAFTGDDDEAEVDITRSFAFSTGQGKAHSPNIHVELNDAPISSEDHTSVGLQSWGSCILFAEKLCASKEVYLSDPRPLPGVDTSKKPLRILELGAGTGMLSIVTAKLLQGEKTQPQPEIIATDYHPDVLANLRKNIKTNFSSSSMPIEVEVLDWESPETDRAPFIERFDIILAADVVYHPEHAKWIEACVSKLLHKHGVFWMFMAIRGSGRHEGLDKIVDATFVSKEVALREREHGGVREGDGHGQRLVVVEQDNIQRQGGVGRADENCYKLSKFVWV
ncbi:hypothetical protein EST38_g11081 [Candolleomyces aberdarensis]|uniref:S-adenosylmethionine-dependent methyltransferase n=1 Tax=Candolleomyces aberdarensis TaxID=2316362 RepID=A0A4Q2D5R4_9AGAR|nr:hypothetical protein EST38_g11081 [Candolleomyces aberdarensis]